MARIREQASDAAYIDETYQLSAVGTKTLVRNSDTQIQINSCNATAHFTAHRRIRIVGATTDHGYVTSSSYSAPNTLVNVTMDSDDVPTTPTQILVHVDSKIRSAAYYRAGAGNNLDADLLDGYQASDIFSPSIFADALVNGSMMVWQRGTSGSCPVGTRTYHADRWWTNPAGAAVTCARTTSTPTGAISKYAKLITGAASVTTCEIAGQRIESNLIPYIKSLILVSALVKNDTGASLTLELQLGTATVEDNFASVTAQSANSLDPITSGASARISFPVIVSGYSGIDNGLEVKFVAPSGSLDSVGKSITITEIQIDRATTFSYFRFRPFTEEHLRCQRYYRKTFPYGTAPAQNVGSVAGALHSLSVGQQSGNPRAAVHWQFPVPMRSAPTVVTFNPNSAASSWDEIGGGSNPAATVTGEGDCGAFIYSATNAGVNLLAIHATAESEL
jgi:hypothetical protein